MHAKGGFGMSSTLLLAVLVVLGLWAIMAYAIWQWGPGLRRRSVWCPVMKKRARVLALQKEALFFPSYAGLSVIDIKECSLFGHGPVKCHKECMQRM
jgi:hypothetical protein